MQLKVFLAIGAAAAVAIDSMAVAAEHTKLRVHVHSYEAYCTGADESPMSVEGVEGIYCVTGQACSGGYSKGACPGPQEGLRWGSYCGKVVTDVYGCKAYSSAGTKAEGTYAGVPEEEEEEEAEEGKQLQGTGHHQEHSGGLLKTWKHQGKLFVFAVARGILSAINVAEVVAAAASELEIGTNTTLVATDAVIKKKKKKTTKTN